MESHTVSVPRPESPDQNSIVESPDSVLANAWAMLSRAVAERESVMRTPVLATIGLDGRPRARVVVLRRVEVASREIYFHTDRRSPKFAELSRDLHTQVVFYEPAAKVQIRVEGLAHLHTGDATADEQWSRSHPATLECYRSAKGSSEPIEDMLATGRPFIDGKPNFAVLRVEVAVLEWLWLHPEGHKRIAFDLSRGMHQWLAP